MTFDLFAELGANDKQLDFPILYGTARAGVVHYNLDDTNEDIEPLFEMITRQVPSYPDKDDLPLQFQISALAYDDYIGRLGIGRISQGTLHPADIVAVSKRDGSVVKAKVNQVFVNVGLKRTETPEAHSGDIVVISGISDISIGETICLPDNVLPLPMIAIEEPTMSMNFYVNNSPFAGKVGKFVTTRHIAARLKKELETNVGLRVEPIEGSDAYKVSGRGELHLSILIENMRREGYELSVSKPEVLFREKNGKRLEPYEKVSVSAPDEYIGNVIAQLNLRKGAMQSMLAENGHTKVEYLVPTRALLGYRSEFINDTRGEGILLRAFDSYGPYAGEIPGRQNGVLISQEDGQTMAYSLFNLSDRGRLFVGPSEDVYEGMIIGMNNRPEDMVVNPTKNKKLTNTRAAGSDEAIKLLKPLEMSLEAALEFVEPDEWVEVTPTAIRMRKKILNAGDRIKYNRSRS